MNIEPSVDPPAEPGGLEPSGNNTSSAMRTIKRTGTFKRDYKREKKGHFRATLDQDLLDLVALLAGDKTLPERNHDHALSGDWKDHRDCHIKPDLILIYRKPDDDSLELVRLGSHSELGL